MRALAAILLAASLATSAQAQSGPALDHEARAALESFSQCVVRQSAGEAGRVLAMDFTSANYRTGLRKLAEDSAKPCANKSFDVGTLRSSNLLFAGELAEALLEAGEMPLGNRLARAAAGAPTPSFSFTDKVAVCAVRSAPDQVANLFATNRGTVGEAAVVVGLNEVVALCAKAAEARQPLDITPPGLRAMLATAAFRSIKSSEVPA